MDWNELTAQSDADLVALTVAGNYMAFDEIVRRHQAMVVRVVYRFCPHGSDVEDLSQDVFVKAYKQLSKWKPTAAFENWLRKIAYNTGYDFIRSKKRNPIRLADKISELNDWELEVHSSQTDHRQKSQSSEIVHLILAELAESDRILLTLQFLEEMPLKEIAEQQKWSLEKTKVKSSRARIKLRKILERYGIEEI